MVDFLSLLPEHKRDAIRRKLAAERREVARLYGLPDRWLGEAILKIGRMIRASTPENASLPAITYNYMLIATIIPEIARRLGCNLNADENAAGLVATLPDYTPIRSLDNPAFRSYAALVVWNIQTSYFNEPADPNADLQILPLLTAHPCNGNALAIALDRIAAPSAADDPIAKAAIEVYQRRGLGRRSVFTPETLLPIAAVNA